MKSINNEATVCIYISARIFPNSRVSADNALGELAQVYGSNLF